MKYEIVLLVLIFSSCANTNSRQCPTVSEEPISICRAKKSCTHSGTNLGLFLMGVGGQDGTSQLNNCIERDLKVQKENYQIKNR